MKKRQVTIKDIARQLKISHSTVSRALSPDRKVSALVNEKTRRRVQQTADQMNYSPNLMARGMVTHETGTLGLLTYQTFEESSQTDQILRAVSKQGYQVVMGVAADRFSKDPQNDQIHQIKQLLSRGIDGLLINWRGYQGEPERVADARAGTSARGDLPGPDSKPERSRAGRDNEFLRGHRAFDPVGSRADRVYRIGLESEPRGFSQGQGVFSGDAKARPDPQTHTC